MFRNNREKNDPSIYSGTVYSHAMFTLVFGPWKINQRTFKKTSQNHCGGQNVQSAARAWTLAFVELLLLKKRQLIKTWFVEMVVTHAVHKWWSGITLTEKKKHFKALCWDKKDIWIKRSKAFEKALEKKIEKCAPPPPRVLALKKSKPCHCKVSICRPHMKRGGKLSNRIRLKHQLHVFAHSTSDWFYYNLVKHVHNFSPSGWVSFKSVCRHVQKVTLKSLSALSVFHWMFDLPSQFQWPGLWTI